MKDIRLKNPEDGFSTILKIGRHRYILSDTLIYGLQVIDLSDTIAECCARKYGLPINRKHSVKIEFGYDSDDFSINTVEWHDGTCGYGNQYSSENRIESIINMHNLLSEKDILLIDPTSTECCITMSRYQINPEEYEDELLISPKFMKKLIIKSDKTGLCYFIGEQAAGMEEIESFFNNTIFNKNDLISCLNRLAFNCHVGRPGFKDIYFELKEIFNYGNLREIFRMTNVELLRCYSDLSSSEFYLLAEYYIKNDIKVENVINELPTLTEKPFPDPKSMVSVSKKTMEFLKRTLKNVDPETLSIFSEMESNPKIGVNNVHLLVDFFDMLDKADRKIVNGWDSSFSTYVNNAATVNDILNSFECSMKNLIEKAIRAIFYYNMNPNNYFTTIMDYHRMCIELGVEPGKKIPADVIARHDKLAVMVADIREKKILEKFEKQAAENKKLVEQLPSDEQYTILAPEEPSDLVNEGNALNHCVGSYGKRVASGDSKIFFLRKKNNLNVPYVTIELNANNALMQSRAFSNTDPSKEDLQYIYRWMDIIGGNYDK